MFDPFANKSSVVKTAENLAKPSRGHAERRYDELTYFYSMISVHLLVGLKKHEVYFAFPFR